MSDQFSLLRNTSQLSTFSQTKSKTSMGYYTKINPPNRSIFSSNIQTSRSNNIGVFNRPKQNGIEDISFIKKSFLFSKEQNYQLNKDDYFYNSDQLVNHIKNKIADIVNRKTENKNEPTSLTSNVTNINGITNNKKDESKVALISKVDEIKNFLYNNDREKGKIKEKLDNASKNDVTSFKTKYNLVKDIYPHVDMYENKKLFNKSASCQRIDHMNRVINLELNGRSNQNNNGYINNLFHLTAEGRIKSKIRQLSNFSIFPDYNARKIDIELKKQYAKNNLNIIGGIKDKFEQNKKEADNEEVEKLQKLKEKLKDKEELEEDINIDDLIN